MENKRLLEGLDADVAKEVVTKMILAIDRSKFENVELERIQLNVAAATTRYDFSHTTSFRHKRIIGIAFSISDESVLEGSTMSVSIDSIEVFPDGTEAKLLFASNAVAPNEKFYTYIDREINQTKVDVSFTSNTFVSAYTATFYLMCQKKD
jgi:lipoate-protein ligase A